MKGIILVQNWLDKLKEVWLNKDFDGIRALFAEDVEYWETPYRQLNGVNAVVAEWQAIKDQTDIELTTHCIVQQDDLSVVKWDLSYTSNGNHNHWSGIYLIKLSSEGKCFYFYQVGESES